MRSVSTIFIVVFLFGITSFSIAQTDWTKSEGNPVLSPGPAGAWDEDATAAPSVLFDGSTYHMWYNSINDNYEIFGYATSEDGISWDKYDDPATTEPPFSESDPVLNTGPSGSWDELAVFGPSVLLVENTFHIWYTGIDGGENFSIGHATSTDGITWEKDAGNPVLEVGSAGTWDYVGIQVGSVIYEQDTYQMWYYSWNISGHVRIGYATSDDGVSWAKHENNPVMEPSESWEENTVRRPIVLFDGAKFNMWYSGGEYNQWRVGYATSPDGINWTKYVDNPVLKKGEAGSWDDYAAAYCSVLMDTVDNFYRMWYSGSDAEWSYQTGYATAPMNINVPDDYETIQAAIDAARDGDVVLVSEGTYYENINFRGKAITVASQFYMNGDTSHISNTIIEGSQAENPDSASVVYFTSGEDTTSLLMGFTITGGTGTFNTQYNVRWGGGIACWFSGASIISNKILNNIVSDNSAWVFGGGIGAGYIGSNAYVILENNQIINNKLNSTGDGAFGGGVGLVCNGRLVNNNISNNSCISTAYESRGGGVLISAGSEDFPRSVLVKKNTITHNLAAGIKFGSGTIRGARGGGILAYYSKVLILENDISHNHLEGRGTAEAFGGGICMIEADNQSLISNNIISYNTMDVNMTNGGGGIRLRECDVPVTNNIIHGNESLGAGGISLSYSAASIVNNTITDNSYQGIYSAYDTPVVLNSILWGNETITETQIGGNTQVFHSNIQGGWSGWGNIDTDPLFIDTLYHLSAESPCIDAGHDSSFFYDLGIGGIAEWPAMGTLRNDQGAYGGPRDYDITALRNVVDYITGIDDGDAKVVRTFQLNQNYPNPFNPNTIINYELPITNKVELSIYNLLGQKVATLLSEKQSAGSYQVEWDAAGFASGIYYYQIKAGEFQDVKKMILLR